MVRRGEALRDHILWVGKDVFLELGFERASMDLIASRARTSKRSLYAHFESKEKLFLAVIELVRGLFFKRLRWPNDYSEQPTEALTLFLFQYLNVLTYEASVQMSRMSLAETERFPEQATLFYDVWFTQVHARLSDYLQSALGITADSSTEAAQRLLGQVLYPRFARALFGLDPLKTVLEDTPPTNAELNQIRPAVMALMDSLR